MASAGVLPSSPATSWSERLRNFSFSGLETSSTNSTFQCGGGSVLPLAASLFGFSTALRISSRTAVSRSRLSFSPTGNCISAAHDGTPS